MQCRVNSRRWRQSVRVLALLSIFWMVPVPASADPIPIQDGRFGIWSSGGDNPSVPDPLLELLYYFDLGGYQAVYGEAYATSAPHYSIGGLLVTRAPVVPGLVPGALHNLSTTATWTFGSIIDSTVDPSQQYGNRTTGTFRVTAGDAVLERSGDQLVGRAPFTFEAEVFAFSRATGAPLFERRYQGGGTAGVYLYPTDPEFFVYVYDVSPVPEPATLLLFGGGLALIAARRRARSPVDR